ncbi:hypothetical protein Tco_1468375 [Tanacetum coccineum]
MSKEVGTPRYLSLVVPLKKVGDEAVHKELGDIMERAATTASSLEAEQDSGSGPRCQDTILGDVDAQTRFEITSKQSNDPPLSRGYTLGSGEDSMKLLELMGLCTQLDNYYGKQYYHGEQLNASLMVSGLRCYTPVIGKITVVILVRDRCPRGKEGLSGAFPAAADLGEKEGDVELFRTKK